MAAFIYIAAILVFAFISCLTGVYLLHMAQLEGYKPRQYWWWIEHNFKNLFMKDALAAAFAAVLYIVFRAFKYSHEAAFIVLLVWAVAGAYFTIIPYFTRKKEAKKPLVFTHRVIRLTIVNCLFLILWAFVIYTNSNNPVVFILYLSVLKLLLPINMILSLTAVYPVEMGLQYRYFRSAQMKIRGMKGLKVIGITGSYGKTSTKYFVKTILSERYNAIMTPESYNTPMGITRVIREQLNEEHEVFVCEMGARNVGDIKTLCRLASPSIGILTSIGPQHLETFKSIGNVAKTKYELIQSLPFDGTAIFNGDNSYCLELGRKTGIETFIYSINNREKDTFIYATEIKNSKEGLKFKVKGQDGIEFECQTGLLGKHNVSNILAAVCVALKLGLTAEEIQRGVSKIKPVPHRLEILPTNNGVTVIDDAFNSNPVGAREALDAIKEMTEGSRIVVTPGMVELGALEYEENKKFGKSMAECVDYAILVGKKRSKPIVEGLISAGFSEDRIIIAGSLNEATARLGQIVKAGDVVLFENDLPDNYNEE